MTKTITQGRYTASISKNGEGDMFVIVTRDGQCLHGIPSKHYADMKRAIKGAERMLAKASA